MIQTKITVILENRSNCDHLGCEHGLSYFIERAGESIIFDTGQSGLFLENADKLGFDAEQCSHVVLSHGHYDHTGGLPFLLKNNRNIHVWGHPKMSISRYSIKDDSSPREIGIPAKAKASLLDVSFHSTLGKTEIVSGLFATGQVPRVNEFEDTGGPFYLDLKGEHPDEIEDDQALWFESEKGLVVLFGCAHSGSINTIELILKQSGLSNVHAVIGGFHLLNASQERLNKTLEFFKSLNPDVIAPCHCTGEHVIPLFESAFPQQFKSCMTGSVLEF